VTKIKQDQRIHHKNRLDPVRARNEDGTLKADDPATPETNEAWEGGVAPKKEKANAKKSGKKAASKS
jgi:hypothetical protein